MSNHRQLFILLVTALALLVGCSGQSDVTMTDRGVLVATDKLDVELTRVGSFAGTYVLFGGNVMNQGDSFSKIYLAGLDANTARSIHAYYPDFRECKSPGARMAQQEIRDFHIVPIDSKTMRELKKSLALSEKNLGKDAALVCVELEGKILSLESIVVRELEQDITNTLPAQMFHEYHLVESAKVTDFDTVLAAF
jgi:hypothetical protein